MLMYNMLLKVTNAFLVKPGLVLFILGSFGCSLDREKKSETTNGVNMTTGSISLVYGNQQKFKYRHADINVLGSVDGPAPYQRSVYQLNDGAETYFYVKSTSKEWDEISRNRLNSKGDFNIEIPVSDSELKIGSNRLNINIVDSAGTTHQMEMEFRWDAEPVSLPLDLRNLSKVKDLQDIGQIVNGAFELDTAMNLIRTRSPVGKDVLLLLGSPGKSQEAVYSVKFGDTTNCIFIGLSDFFAGHESANPAIGIKPGWSSAGLATIRPDQARSAQIWLAWGDLLDSPEKWVVKTDPPKPLAYELSTVYRVRHQVWFRDGINMARFKVWRSGEKEPDQWLCEDDDSEVPDDKIKFTKGSFGLFQFGGGSTEWFDIYVRALEN